MATGNLETVESRENGVYVRTLAEVGDLVSRSRETVKGWGTQGAPGRVNVAGVGPRYDARAWIRWRDEHVGVSGRNDDQDLTRSEILIRLDLAKTKTIEFDLAIKKGQFIDVDDVIREDQHCVAHGRALLEQIPDRLLGLLPAGTTGEDKRVFRAAAEAATDDVIAVMFAYADQRCRGSQTESEQADE